MFKRKIPTIILLVVFFLVALIFSFIDNSQSSMYLTVKMHGNISTILHENKA